MAKKWGDRRDAVRVRDIDSFHSFMVHLMPNRTDAEVYMHTEIDVTELMEMIRKRNDENSGLKMTLFHAFVAATAKIIKQRPHLNRYISGRRFYQRHDITMSFVAKKQFTDHSEEAMMILKPRDNYTLADFSREIVGEVHKAREGGDEYGADAALNLIAKAPVFITKIFMFFLKKLDEHGRVPDSLYYVDPNQTTVLLSNLGSIKCDAVYHHLNNYGSNSIVITIGKVYKKSVHDENGVRVRDILPVGATVDERISDGFYFARSLKLLSYILENPHLLDKPLSEEIEYEY